MRTIKLSKDVRLAVKDINVLLAAGYLIVWEGR